MSSLIDAAGAALLFGAVMLIILNLNSSMMEATYQNDLRIVSQEQLSGIDTLAGAAKILEKDFLKIGSNASPAFVIADSNKITFNADLNNDGVVDSVKYFLTVLSIPIGGNANLKYRLIRRQNSESGTAGGIGVSQFKLTYYDSLGRSLNTPVSNGLFSKIRSIKMQIQTQNNVRVKNDIDTSFASSYWENIISPKNLRAVK